MSKRKKYYNYACLTMLTGVMMLGLAMFAQAAQATEKFGAQGVQFDVDTIV